MPTGKVSLPLIKRLPRYYRYVSDLKKNGVTTISSSELAGKLGTTASQVRQDFNNFGGFGQQGIGYTVDVLYDELGKLLLGGSELDVILIGTGRLGRAVTHFLADEVKGFRLIGLFDAAPSQVGQQLVGLRVQDVADLQDFCRAHKPQVAVLCVPEKGAEALGDSLFELGIQGFWNFSHYDLTAVKPGVVVENVHLGDSLMGLGFRVRQNEE